MCTPHGELRPQGRKKALGLRYFFDPLHSLRHLAPRTGQRSDIFGLYAVERTVGAVNIFLPHHQLYTANGIAEQWIYGHGILVF